ncbi:ATP-dependent helicase [Yinghuangia sp. ASG 101]|uniref:ATP-dependent DNA helicase n=1 Tax=Yinghuangia sp. ASG 101 TaxID=2896848 RepID=UPI001E2D5472|nr:ATP-dependent DNA helicase [Yinghuangia sp. ASG 101]UGQ14396.1 ATP-dependent helicase [Yinghuangia sp. ASG 101]
MRVLSSGASNVAPVRSAHPTLLRDEDDLKRVLKVDYSPEQIAAITAPLEPGVIVAGAGSGKTTVMTARVVWLVGTGAVRPDAVLGLTFTNKAAGELAERVDRALRHLRPDADVRVDDEEAGDPTISTYHAFAGRLLTEHGLRIGLEPSARLLADATRFQLAARAARRAPGPFPTLTKTLSAVIADVLALGGELAEHLVPVERLREFDRALIAEVEAAPKPSAGARAAADAARNRLDLSRLVSEYADARRRRDLLDFGDQIAYAAQLAEERPEVGETLRDTYKVVLLDEYQDTSVAQRRLLAGLFGVPEGTAPERAPGRGHPVTAVGDPCQAIYGWRGASVANLDEFPRHFPRRDGSPAPRFALAENRRSGGRLLAFANELAAPLREMHEGVEALRPGPGADDDGWVRCGLLATQDGEIAWVADQVQHVIGTRFTPEGDLIGPRDVAVLARTAADFAEIHKALVEREIPVEVVGLSGLLNLPEVADLVATCEVLDDPTANAALVRLLVGPRWRVGPRDLALLGRRAGELVRFDHGAAEGPDARLEQAVAGVDPTEVVSLSDALSDLGDDHPFSTDARIRFARLAAEIRELRRHLGEPLMDVLHRVLTVTGLEVELSASPGSVAARRRETLHAFLDVAAGFADLDGDPSLTAFLAFLRTAAEHDKGLDGSLPSARDSVQVLTAHKSKGMEWEVVVVPGLVDGAFPSVQAQAKWTKSGHTLPHPLRGDAAGLPELADLSAKSFKAFDAAMREHKSTEELRLGYVTFTRPKQLLIASGHWWGRTRKKPRGPSEFLLRLAEHCEAGDGDILTWAPEPTETDNPHLLGGVEHAWPLPLDAAALEERRRAARDVIDELVRLEHRARPDTPGPRGPAPSAGTAPVAAVSDPPDVFADDEPPFPDEPPPDEEELPPPPEDDGGAGGWWDDGPDTAAEVPAARPAADDTAAEHDGAAGADGFGADDPAPPADAPGLAPLPDAAEDTDHLGPADRELIESWDQDLDRLVEELLRGRSGVRDVDLPASLSASQLLRLASDPDGLARELARPMPRPPAPAARRGTRFHAWIEAQFGERPLLEPDDLPGAADEDITDEADLVELQQAFLATPYAQRAPYRIEESFQLVLGGRVVRGRIDAVYRDADGRYEVVDWKTNRSFNADPLQLAVYRLAWAERAGVPPDEVTASFVYVRSGEVVRPRGLPDRAGIERVLSGKPKTDV